MQVLFLVRINQFDFCEWNIMIVQGFQIAEFAYLIAWHTSRGDENGRLRPHREN